MANENNAFYVEEEYIDSKNNSAFGILLELSWDSPKYLTNLKGLFQLLETKYISNCDYPTNPTRLQAFTFGCLQAEPNKTDYISDEISALEIPPNLNFSFFLLKSMDDIKGCMISLDLIKRILPTFCISENTTIISHYVSKLFDQDRLQYYPELLQRLNNLAPLEKECISQAVCASLLPRNFKNRDFYNFLLTNAFIFDIIDFVKCQEFWSYVPVDLLEQNRDSLVNTLNLSNIEFYAYLPKFYHLLEDSSAECDQLLTLIKNKDLNVFLLLIFNLFLNKTNLLK